MIERKEFHSIEIDLNKDIFLLNGKPIDKFVDRMELEFNNGKWLLLISYTVEMQQVTGNEKN